MNSFGKKCCVKSKANNTDEPGKPKQGPGRLEAAGFKKEPNVGIGYECDEVGKASRIGSESRFATRKLADRRCLATSISRGCHSVQNVRCLSALKNGYLYSLTDRRGPVALSLGCSVSW